MLIIQIALGIVLAVLVLAFLPQLLSISIWLAVAAIALAVIFGIFALSYNLISDYIPDIKGVILALLVLLLLTGLVVAIYQFISKLIGLIKPKIANLYYSNNVNFSSIILLIFSVFWDNFNDVGKIALIGIFFLIMYGLFGGGF
jgi:hypothetical protein